MSPETIQSYLADTPSYASWQQMLSLEAMEKPKAQGVSKAFELLHKQCPEFIRAQKLVTDCDRALAEARARARAGSLPPNELLEEPLLLRAKQVVRHPNEKVAMHLGILHTALTDFKNSNEWTGLYSRREHLAGSAYVEIDSWRQGLQATVNFLDDESKLAVPRPVHGLHGMTPPAFDHPDAAAYDRRAHAPTRLCAAQGPGIPPPASPAEPQRNPKSSPRSSTPRSSTSPGEIISRAKGKSR